MFILYKQCLYKINNVTELTDYSNCIPMFLDPFDVFFVLFFVLVYFTSLTNDNIRFIVKSDIIVVQINGSFTVEVCCNLNFLIYSWTPSAPHSEFCWGRSEYKINHHRQVFGKAEGNGWWSEDEHLQTAIVGFGLTNRRRRDEMKG